MIFINDVQTINSHSTAPKQII